MPRLLCLLWALTLTLAASAPALAEDWPRWRGPRGDGTWIGPELAQDWPATGLRTRWKAQLAGAYSGVTVAHGRAYTLDRPDPNQAQRQLERVLCFDLESGRLLWQHAYDADYGDLTYNTGPRASVTLHEGRAYTLGAVGHALCLDAATGKPLWSIDTVQRLHATRPHWGFAASPLIHGDTVILHVGAPRGCVVAVDRLTGAERWRGGEDPAGYATPYLIAPGRPPEQRESHASQLICWTPQSVLSLSPRDGATLWRYPYPIQYGVSIHTPVYDNGVLFVSSYWHGPRALRVPIDPQPGTPPTVEVLWQHEKLLCGLMSQPLVRDGHGYILDKDHGLSCFEMSTGKKLWDDAHRLTPRGRNPQANLVWLGAGDRALAMNSRGELALLSLTPRGVRELARTQVVGETWAHPAFAGRCVVARSDREIVCVELP